MEPWAHVLLAGELPLSHIPSPEEIVTIKEDCRSPGFKMTKNKKSQEENWNLYFFLNFINPINIISFVELFCI